MKNKVNYILVLIMIVFSFMNSVYAEEDYNLNLELDVESLEVVSGDEVIVSVKLKTELPIKDCLIKIDADQSLEYIDKDAEIVNLWKFSEIGVNGILVENQSSNVDFKDGLNILHLKYKVNGHGSLKISSSSYCADGEKNEYDVTNTGKIDLVAKSLDEITTLKTIKVNGKVLDKFSPNKTDDYGVHIEKGKFSLEYETTNPDFQDDVVVTTEDGTRITDLSNITFNDPTNQGMMSINLTVNNVTTYTFVAFYEAKELDNTLKSLKIDGKTVDIKPGQVDGYVVKVAKDLTKVKVEAVLTDSVNFKFELQESGVWEQTISGAKTTIPISIVPVSNDNGGTSNIYTIEVVREGVTEPVQSSPTTKPSDSKDDGGPNGGNPGTGDISMFIMALILVASLVGSVILYQKNIENYK